MFMRFLKHICYILLALPLYVIFNNIIMNCLFFISSRKIHLDIFGFYCSLKKHQYNLSENFYLICLGYFFLKSLLFVPLFFKLKFKNNIEQIFIAIFTLDLIGILSFIAFHYEYAQTFKLYFSFSSIFLLSGHLFNLTLILPFLLIIIEFFILYKKAKSNFSNSIPYFLFLSLLSVLFWWYTRIIYNLLIN